MIEKLLERLANLREEREGNHAEEERVQGREIRYGNAVILVIYVICHMYEHMTDVISYPRLCLASHDSLLMLHTHGMALK